MIKTKYDRMSKEEKKELLEKYKKTEHGKVMMNRLYRLKVIGIISFILSVILIVFQYQTIKITDYLTIVPLFLASLLFMMMSEKLRKKVLNQFAIKKEK